MKQTFLSFARLSGLARLAYALTRHHTRILCYHGLWVTPGYQYGNRLFMPPEQFEERMERLARSGRPVLPLNEAVDSLARGKKLRDGATVITIDDGWASTYSHMLPVLERLQLPATLYVTTWYVDNDLPIVGKAIDYLLQSTTCSRVLFRGEWVTLGGMAEREALAGELARDVDSLPTVEERAAALRKLSTSLEIDPDIWWGTRQFHLMNPAEVRDAARRGLDIQLHTHRHIPVDRQVGKLRDEVSKNRDRLAAMLGGECSLEHFCYPSGSYHPGAETILRSMGVRSATLVEQGLNAPGANVYRLRRFLDGRSVSNAEFDAYMDGVLQYTDAAGAYLRSRSSISRERPKRQPLPVTVGDLALARAHSVTNIAAGDPNDAPRPHGKETAKIDAVE